MTSTPDIADHCVLIILLLIMSLIILTLGGIVSAVIWWRKNKYQRKLWARWRANKITSRNNFYKSIGK